MALKLGPLLMPNFMTGASFHSILAWPTTAEWQRFTQVSQELMADVIRLTNAENPTVAQGEMNQWPEHNWAPIEAKAKKPKRALGYLAKRLNQRMAAAKVGIGKAHREIFGIPAILPPGMTALSIDQLCKTISSDVSINDPENIEKLIWRPSLPVIHVAMAVQLMLTARGGQVAGFNIDLQDIDFYRQAVQMANLLAQVVHDHPQINITRDKLTLIEWFE